MRAVLTVVLAAVVVLLAACQPKQAEPPAQAPVPGLRSAPREEPAVAPVDSGAAVMDSVPTQESSPVDAATALVDSAAALVTD